MAYIGNTAPSRFVSNRAVTQFSGDGSTVVFTLQQVVTQDEDILVSVDGVIQEPSVAYAVSAGTRLEFDAAPSTNSGNNIFVYYLASQVGTVGHPSTQALSATTGTFSSNATVAGTLGVTGDSTVGGTLGVTGVVTANGGAVFNEASADVDFRIESNGNANMVFVDGGNNAVGIGNNTPASFFAGSTNLVVGSGAGANGITIFSAADSTGNIKFADATTNDATKTAGGIRYDHTNNFMRFDTNDGSERMRIASNGKLLYNCTTEVVDSPNNPLVQIDQGTGVGLGIHSSNASNSQTAVVFQNNNGRVGFINIEANTISVQGTSDHRLKENVVTDWVATTRLKQLKPSRFNFITEADITLDGFLAHEVQSIVPEAVSGTHNQVVVWKEGEELPNGVSVGDNKLDADGNTIPEMQGIDQSKLIPLLVKTIQELEARITALEG